MYVMSEPFHALEGKTYCEFTAVIGITTHLL